MKLNNLPTSVWMMRGVSGGWALPVLLFVSFQSLLHTRQKVFLYQRRCRLQSWCMPTNSWTQSNMPAGANTKTHLIPLQLLSSTGQNNSNFRILLVWQKWLHWQKNYTLYSAAKSLSSTPAAGLFLTTSPDVWLLL